MSTQEVSQAYAKSLLVLGKEQKIDMGKELTSFTELINGSNELENLLFMDIFTNDEKTDVLKSILDKTNYSELTNSFINYLLAEKRLSLFPQIFKELTVLEDNEKGFLKGIVEGSDETLSKEVEKTLREYLENKLNMKVNLEYEVNPKITAGNRVTVDDLQLDATLENQLEQFKRSVLE